MSAGAGCRRPRHPAPTPRAAFDPGQRLFWRRARGRGLAAGLAAAALVLASCAPALGPPHRVSAGGTGGSGVSTLGSVSTLRTMFNHDAGRVRLILLLSPT